MIFTKIIANIDDTPVPELAGRRVIRPAVSDGLTATTFAGIPNGTTSGALVVGIIVDLLPEVDAVLFLEVKADTLDGITRGLRIRHGEKPLGGAA
jgi:hypothetical protein